MSDWFANLRRPDVWIVAGLVLAVLLPCVWDAFVEVFPCAAR